MFLFVCYHIIFCNCTYLLLENAPEITTFPKGNGIRFIMQYILIILLQLSEHY